MLTKILYNETMDTFIFLDLENTIIWDWTDDRRLISDIFPQWKDWLIETLAGSHVHVGLFSWAVCDDKDLKEFNRELRKPIEDAFHFKFEDQLIFTLDDLHKKVKGWNKMPFLDRQDFLAFFDKRRIIEDIWLKEFSKPNTHVILIDDTVPNLKMINSSHDNCLLELIDPWTIINK